MPVIFQLVRGFLAFRAKLRFSVLVTAKQSIFDKHYSTKLNLNDIPPRHVEFNASANISVFNVNAG